MFACPSLDLRCRSVRGRANIRKNSLVLLRKFTFPLFFLAKHGITPPVLVFAGKRAKPPPFFGDLQSARFSACRRGAVRPLRGRRGKVLYTFCIHSVYNLCAAFFKIGQNMNLLANLFLNRL